MTRQTSRVSLVLAAGFLVLFVGGGARFAIGLTLKPMVEELGWVRGQLGLAVGLFMVVSATATLIAGRIADRMGVRALLVGGLLVGGMGIASMSMVSAPWHAALLYGLVFAIGNGAASIAPVGVMVTRAVPGRAGLANATVISGMSAGQLIMISVLAAVLASIGWRTVFVWVGVAHFALVPLLLLALSERLGHAQRAAPGGGLGMREVVRTRQFWLLLAVYAVCGLDDFFVSTHVVAYAQDKGVGTLLAGNLLAAMGLTALLGVLAAGVLSDRFGPVPATAAAFIARIAVFALVAVDQSPLSIAIFALVFGATFLVTAPLTVLFVRESFGNQHLGLLTGIVNMVHQIAGGIGAYGGALVFDATGSYQLAIQVMLAATAVALALTLMLARRAPRAGGG